MQITIEKDVPMPDWERGVRSGYPFGEMEVGDSFAIPLSGEMEGVNQCGNPKWDVATRKLTNAAHSYAAYRRRKHGEQKRFSIRTLKKEGVVRCWRVA